MIDYLYLVYYFVMYNNTLSHCASMGSEMGNCYAYENLKHYSKRIKNHNRWNIDS